MCRCHYLGCYEVMPMYECFHCGKRAVIWNGDFDLEDCGYEGVGVVHQCTCTNCGAEIEYVCRFDEEEENE